MGKKYKKCSKCEAYKLLDEFRLRPRFPDVLEAHCRECHRKTSREGTRRRRIEVLTAYSNPPRCQCCGEDDINFLCLDHIDGGGTKHRKTLPKSGNAIYRWVRKKKFPPGFQVLCHNCNMAKGMYGACSHDGNGN